MDFPLFRTDLVKVSPLTDSIWILKHDDTYFLLLLFLIVLLQVDCNWKFI